jgi:hypothetical protein
MSGRTGFGRRGWRVLLALPAALLAQEPVEIGQGGIRIVPPPGAVTGSLRVDGAGSATGLLALASNPKVVEHLKITAEEVDFVKILAQTQREENEKQFAEINDAAEIEARIAKITKHLAQQEKKAAARLEEILGKDRVARLRQVSLQVGGVVVAFRAAELGAKLKITEEQKRKFSEGLGEGAGPMVLRIDGGGGFDPEAFAKQIEEKQKKSRELAESLLADEQRKLWTEMIGEPINFRIDPPKPKIRIGGGEVQPKDA